MTSSSEPRVLRLADHVETTPLVVTDLRSGHWTRLGSGGVLGDRVTEEAMSDLAEKARTAGHAEGYAVGWSLGSRRAEQESRARREDEERQHAEDRDRREQEHARALADLVQAAHALDAAIGDAVARVEQQAAALALELTRELVGEAAATAGVGAVAARVRSALPVPPPGAVLHAHPDVAHHPDADWPAGVTVRSDATLGRADVLVDLDEGVLDLRVDHALQRLAEVLT